MSYSPCKQGVGAFLKSKDRWSLRLVVMPTEPVTAAAAALADCVCACWKCAARAEQMETAGGKIWMGKRVHVNEGRLGPGRTARQLELS